MNVIKKYKNFLIIMGVMVIFIGYVIVDTSITQKQMRKDYEKKIEDLQKVVRVTNLGKTPEKEFDVYQTAEDFLKYYYGISSDVTETYRAEQLQKLMTEAAYVNYEKEYEQDLGYTLSIDNVEIYVDYQNSTQDGVYACIFYKENINWPEVNTIECNKYWKGVFTKEHGEWKVSEILDCQELLTREEFNILNTDTNGSALEDIPGGENSAAEKSE